MDRIRIYTHHSGLKHDTGPDHPERPERLQVLLDLFEEQGLSTIAAPEAELSWIERCHTPAYLDALQNAMPDHRLVRLDSDTVVSPGTWDAALHAAGAVCQAVDDVIASKTWRAFCANRPPGHHAYPDRMEGFCLLNNIVIGALHALRPGNDITKVAIVDFDVHHGNGSDFMARQHDGLFYGGTHQDGIYPNLGQERYNIPGKIVNVPLQGGSPPAAFRAAYTDIVFPALRDYAPDLLMISAGFDAHRDDPLAQLNLVEDDFEWVTRELCAIQPRVVSVLEGGYNLPALKASVESHITALAAEA